MNGLPVAGWKFFADLPQPDEPMLPRAFYVRVADKRAAVGALSREYPRAIIHVDRAQPLTWTQLNTALGANNGFTRGEIVRCVAV